MAVFYTSLCSYLYVLTCIKWNCNEQIINCIKQALVLSNCFFCFPLRACLTLPFRFAFGHMRTAKTQISLRIRAGLSGPSLSANRIIGKYRMYQLKAKARMILCACVEWSESARFAHVRRHFFAWRGPNNTAPDNGIVLVMFWYKLYWNACWVTD